MSGKKTGENPRRNFFWETFFKKIWEKQSGKNVHEKISFGKPSLKILSGKQNPVKNLLSMKTFLLGNLLEKNQGKIFSGQENPRKNFFWETFIKKFSGEKTFG